MGYYSTISINSFYVENVEKAKEIFRKYYEDNTDGYFFYKLKVLNSEGLVAVVPIDGEYTAKHYGDQRLAEAISKIIAPGETVELTFDGEDGTSWGYKITYNKIEDLTKEFLNDEEYLLVKRYRENKLQGLKFVLERYINTISHDPQEFAEAMEDLHPTLQQNLMRLFVAFCKKLATKPTHDDRNKASIKLARQIINLDCHLPFI